MSDFTLAPAPALGGYKATIGTIEIEEVSNLAIVSLAVPRGEDGLKTLNAAMDKAYGAQFPVTGKTTHSADGKVKFPGMAPDQAFAIFDHEGVDADLLVQSKLDNAAYVTLQSDNWLVLKVSGDEVRKALARICQIDLHPDAFAEGDVARTVMEHMGAIITRDGDNSFVVMSAWSSARSFVHAIETAAKDIS